MPERYPRYLGKLLISFLLFVETVLLSLAFNTYIASRNAQSFYLRRFVFLYGAMSSSSPPWTHDVRVVDTSLMF